MSKSCDKCGTVLIVSVGCRRDFDLDKMHSEKRITYFTSGITSNILPEIPCAKCGEKIKTYDKSTPECKKCGIPIVDTGCEMNDKLQDLGNKKEINYIVGKTAAVIEITCVKCGTKFKYDRNKGVVK